MDALLFASASGDLAASIVSAHGARPLSAALSAARCSGVRGIHLVPDFPALILAQCSGLRFRPFMAALRLALASGVCEATIADSGILRPLEEALIFARVSGVGLKQPSPPSVPFTKLIPNMRAARIYRTSSSFHDSRGTSRKVTNSGTAPTTFKLEIQ